MSPFCDALEDVMVGDTKAPLLRIVDKPRRAVGTAHRVLDPTKAPLLRIVDKPRRAVGTAHRVLDPVLYVPLQKKCFDTIEINFMTDTGEPMPFRYGKSFVVLEFRRVVHPYFAI